jgi:hypothetical protein
MDKCYTGGVYRVFVEQCTERQPERAEGPPRCGRAGPSPTPPRRTVATWTPPLAPERLLIHYNTPLARDEGLHIRAVSADRLKAANVLGFGVMGGDAKTAPFSICSGDRVSVMTKGEVVSVNSDSLTMKLSFSSPETIYVWLRPSVSSTVSAREVVTHGSW